MQRDEGVRLDAHVEELSVFARARDVGHDVRSLDRLGQCRYRELLCLGSGDSRRSRRGIDHSPDGSFQSRRP
jgi:hypothetical protein